MYGVISTAGRNLNDINVGAYTRFLASLDMTLVLRLFTGSSNF